MHIRPDRQDAHSHIGPIGQFIKETLCALKTGEFLYRWQIAHAIAEKFYSHEPPVRAGRLAKDRLRHDIFSGRVCHKPWGKRGDEILVQLTDQAGNVVFLWKDRIEYSEL